MGFSVQKIGWCEMRKVVLAFALIGSSGLLSQAGAAQAANDNVMPGPPETLSAWAKGAKIYPGLGHRGIVWAFNHEAAGQFRKAWSKAEVELAAVTF
jgi:hypothetical protein